MNVNVNTQELYDVLESTPAEQNIMIVGKHGIGKSEIVKKFFESRGKKVVVMFCSQAADPGDIIGLPRMNEKTGQTEFSLPWWFPVPPMDENGNRLIDPKTGNFVEAEPVVLFLDELNRARPEILQVVMDLTLNRKLAGKNLPKGSQIISAVNAGDEYQLTDLDPALVSRFNVYNFTPTVKEWINWATENNLDQRVISFISNNNKFLDPTKKDDYSSLDKTPDRRAWERVSNLIKTRKTFDISFKKILCGIVGSNAAVLFFDTIQRDGMVLPEEILTNFSNVSKKLSNYTLQMYTGLVDSLCSYLNVILEDSDAESKSEMYALNLANFFKHLTDSHKGNKEAMAYFISNYEQGSYPNMNFFISDNETLEDMITDFIMETNTR